MIDAPESAATSPAAPKRGFWGRKSCPRWSPRCLPATQLSLEIRPRWAQSAPGLRPPQKSCQVPPGRKGPERHDNPFIFKRSGRKSQVTLCRNSSEPQPGACGCSCQQGQCVSLAWHTVAQRTVVRGGGHPAQGLCAQVRATDGHSNNKHMHVCETCGEPRGSECRGADTGRSVSPLGTSQVI